MEKYKIQILLRSIKGSKRWRRSRGKRMKVSRRAGTIINTMLDAEKEDYRKKGRERNWLKLYGLTPADYYKLLRGQSGVCAICEQPEKSKTRTFLSVDHCHETGKVRALLCNKCNFLLGIFERKGFIHYVAKHRGISIYDV